VNYVKSKIVTSYLNEKCQTQQLLLPPFGKFFLPVKSQFVPPLISSSPLSFSPSSICNRKGHKVRTSHTKIHTGTEQEEISSTQ